MMRNNVDTIVLGLGAMGSAAIYQLAKRGHRVLGIDQFSPPHDYGSSHGETRIIRQAIGEGEEYVPLALRSYELWREIEREAGRELLVITGGLILESQQSNTTMHGRRNFLAQTIQCATLFNLCHEILEPQDIRKRYPQFAVTNEFGYFEYETGYLRPELCIQAQLDLAKRHGANLQTNEKVLSIKPDGFNKGVIVKTDRAVYGADKLIIAAGSWVTQFLEPAHAQYFKVYRQAMFWFKIQDDLQNQFLPGKFPIFIWIFQSGGENVFYGFPSLDGKTIKMASEQYVNVTTPEQVEREITEEEKNTMYKNYVLSRLPGITNACDEAASCLYTTTPDSNFVIDFYPGHPQVIIASPCSGHGFKHSAAIGEVLAEVVSGRKSKIDISSFGIDRLTRNVAGSG
jgi:sarcosine oxidase